MARYIDADALKNDGRICYHDGKGNTYYEVDHAPTADVVEVKHGEWKPIDPESDVCFFCSECETEISTSWDYDEAEMWKYCPCCGAKMDGTPKERGGEKE